ncbi:MAG: metal-dependent hydrolase [Anaerolineae bacterium]
MNGKTHVALGLAAAAALGYDPLQLPVAATLALTAGALLPDLDHRYGAKPLRKPLPPVLRQLAQVPAYLFRHRGPLHSLLVFPPLLLAAQALGYLPAPYGVLAALGCASHLLADALTPAGVPLLWPLVRRRVGLPLVRTGGRIERALAPLLLAGWMWVGRR